jgi:GTP-binding protein
MIRRLAIVGRPNVGKSTLFNRVAGKKLAIVDDTPGVTRDWKEAPARISDLSFIAVDTAGIEDVARSTARDSISAGMRRQTEAALKDADAVLLVFDGREGITAMDEKIADLLRKLDVPVVLCANKCESGVDLEEAFELGFGEAVAISAAHGDGMVDLLHALRPHLAPNEDEDNDFEPEDKSDKPLRLALVGRPNAGKSTLLNALLGEERAMVSPVAGTTRDTIAAKWEWQGRSIRLVDTAGLRRKARIDEKLEKMAIAETLRIIRLAELVVLVCDASGALEAQDLAIADLVLREGRSLVIALNKWDLVENQAKVMDEARKRADESLSQARGIPLIPISALKGRKLDVLMKAIVSIHEKWDTRITTGQLNKWLEPMLEAHQLPLVNGRRVKIRYVTQRKSRPPTFVLFCGSHAAPPDSYVRYLTTGLRERFGLHGVPVRMEVKHGKNPYADEGEGLTRQRKPAPLSDGEMRKKVERSRDREKAKLKVEKEKAKLTGQPLVKAKAPAKSPGKPLVKSAVKAGPKAKPTVGKAPARGTKAAKAPTRGGKGAVSKPMGRGRTKPAASTKPKTRR